MAHHYMFEPTMSWLLHKYLAAAHPITFSELVSALCSELCLLGGCWGLPGPPADDKQAARKPPLSSQKSRCIVHPPNPQRPLRWESSTVLTPTSAELIGECLKLKLAWHLGFLVLPSRG
eukprot:5044659-Amphidinium_carterae.1